MEIAVLFFEQDRLTLEQASRLADVPQADFIRILGGRGIGLHYDESDFADDLETLTRLDRV